MVRPLHPKERQSFNRRRATRIGRGTTGTSNAEETATHAGRLDDHILLLSANVARIVNNATSLVVVQRIGTGANVLQIGLYLASGQSLCVDAAVLLRPLTKSVQPIGFHVRLSSPELDIAGVHNRIGAAFRTRGFNEQLVAGVCD